MSPKFYYIVAYQLPDGLAFARTVVYANTVEEAYSKGMDELDPKITAIYPDAKLVNNWAFSFMDREEVV